LQGQEINDSTVLMGEKWEMFANPATFPGVPPKLVKVEFGSLSLEERMKVQNTPEEVEKPRHAGVIKSDFIKEPKVENAVVVPVVSLIKTGDKKIDPESAVVKKEVELQQQQSQVHKITDVYEISYFIKDFPGITEKNVKKVLEKFQTIEDLLNSNNSDLSQVGVRTKYFGNIRGAAKDVLENLAREGK